MTGVQTCALPISVHGVLQSAGRRRHDRRVQGIYHQAGQKGGTPLGTGKAATLQVAHSGGCGGQDKAEGAGTMKQVNVKKLILPNINLG